MFPFHALPGTLAEGLWDTLFFSSPDLWEVLLQNTTTFYIDLKRDACLPLPHLMKKRKHWPPPYTSFPFMQMTVFPVALLLSICSMWPEGREQSNENSDSPVQRVMDV